MFNIKPENSQNENDDENSEKRRREKNYVQKNRIFY